MTSKKVAVGLLNDSQGNILLCQRPATSRYPLKWEFPGGKLEVGETPFVALARELMEEMSISISDAKLIFSQSSVYPDGGSFEVYYFSVNTWSGELQSLAFSDMKWVTPQQAFEYDILTGNIEILQQLVLGNISL